MEPLCRRRGRLVSSSSVSSSHPVGCARRVRGVRRVLVLGAAAAVASLARALTRGELTIDTGVGRSLRPLGPLSWKINAAPDVVFDVIAEPYLGRTPRALANKLRVWERSREMVLAAHFTPLRTGVTTTLETVQFERPTRVSFRLVRGPVPHVSEAFELAPARNGTVLTWQGELGTDFWAAGRWWGSRVARTWERTVRASVETIRAEAERRSGRPPQPNNPPT